MNIKHHIKRGKSLGKSIAHTATDPEKQTIREWLTDSENSVGKVLNDITEEDAFEARREIYKNCDIQASWERVQLRVAANRRRRRIRRMVSIIGNSAAAVAGIIILIGIVLHSNDKSKEAQTFKEIAQLKPTDNTAILYLADGSTVELNDRKSYSDIEGISIEDGVIEYEHKTTTKPETEFNELFIPRGSEFELRLPDGSKVKVNSETRIRYFANNNVRERRVWLDGEAYFVVEKDAERPFIVESASQKIRVLGTTFNINTFDGETATTLVEGSVHLSATTGDAEVTLSPGDHATITHTQPNEISVRQVNAEKYTSWTSGVFMFDNASLREIMNTISRWYDFDFELSPRLESLTFSGQFPRYSELDKVLQVLTYTGHNIQTELNGRIITLE